MAAFNGRFYLFTSLSPCPRMGRMREEGGRRRYNPFLRGLRGGSSLFLLVDQRVPATAAAAIRVSHGLRGN